MDHEYSTESRRRPFMDGDKPNVVELERSYRETVTDLDTWIHQQRENYNIRHCLWANQTDDGRKHGDRDNPAFPWENASDLRTFIVDQLITHDVSLLSTSLKRANLVAMPVEAGDMKRAKLVSAFMRWLMFSEMTEIETECELLANYYLEKGIAALGIFWETKVSNRLQEVTLEDMQELSPELAGYINDKEYAGELTDLMQATFPQLSRRKARKMVTELRNNGVTNVGMPEVEYQRPVIRAYSLDKDLFIPMGTTSLQKAPYIWKEEWYTPDQLRSKVITSGWDEDFIEHVIRTQREGATDDWAYGNSEWDSKYGLEGNQKTEDIKLICGYYKASDEDGLEETWYTVFHPDITDVPGAQDYAYHGRLEYSPSRFPFVIFQRERISRRLLETRGYPEIAKGWQDQIKIERDTRTDRGSLATNPPFLFPQGRPVSGWGPGAKIPYRRRDDYGWAEIPTFDQGSIEVEQMLTNTARKYFGRPTSEEDKTEAQTIQQYRVQKWLNSWKEVFRQVWSLYQQYGPEEQFFRIVGSEPNPEVMVKGDQQEKYDFYIEFDVPGLDPEYNLKKLKEIAGIAAQHDRTGRTDWSAMLGKLIGGVDPTIADEVLLPAEEASEKEVNEEKDLLKAMWSGMDVDLIPPYNVELRTQVFQDWLTGSETIPATDVQKRLQEDEAFRARVEKHQQQLQMQKMQQENAQIGKTGAKEGNM